MFMKADVYVHYVIEVNAKLFIRSLVCCSISIVECTMKLKILLTLVAVTVEVSQCISSELDEGKKCVVQYLKEKGKLNPNFPSNKPNPNCRLVLGLVVSAIENGMIESLTYSSPNSACVTNEFKNRESIDIFMKIEAITLNKEMNENEIEMQLKEAKDELKENLNQIGRACDTDPSFGGQFDHILGIKNDSLAVLQQKYCLAKYVVDNNVLVLKDVDINPDRISIENIECGRVIDNYRHNELTKIKDGSTSISPLFSDCMIQKYLDDDYFNVILALKVLEEIPLRPKYKREETERLNSELVDFNMSILNCVLQNTRL